MIDLIKSIEGWQDKTAAEIVEYLNAETIRRIDSQLYTYAGIFDKIGVQNGFVFRATVRNLADKSNPASLPSELFEALDFAHDRFSVGGLDLSRQDVIDMLDALTIIPNLAPFIPSIKRIGVWYESLAGHMGLPPVTEQEVNDALAILQLRASKEALISAGAQRWNSYVESVELWDGSGEAPVL